MDKIARMSRPVRRQLFTLGRRSGDPATALRFLIVARLGLGHRSPRVATDLDVARSTVVKAAKRFVAEGGAALFDHRRNNGRAKVDALFRRRVAHPSCDERKRLADHEERTRSRRADGARARGASSRGGPDEAAEGARRRDGERRDAWPLVRAHLLQGVPEEGGPQGALVPLAASLLHHGASFAAGAASRRCARSLGTRSWT